MKTNRTTIKLKREKRKANRYFSQKSETPPSSKQSVFPKSKVRSHKSKREEKEFQNTPCLWRTTETIRLLETPNQTEPQDKKNFNINGEPGRFISIFNKIKRVFFFFFVKP